MITWRMIVYFHLKINSLNSFHCLLTSLCFVYYFSYLSLFFRFSNKNVWGDQNFSRHQESWHRGQIIPIVCRQLSFSGKERCYWRWWYTCRQKWWSCHSCGLDTGSSDGVAATSVSSIADEDVSFDAASKEVYGNRIWNITVMKEWLHIKMIFLEFCWKKIQETELEITAAEDCAEIPA